MSHSRPLSCKYCTHRVKVCRGAHLRFVIMVYIAEDTSRIPFPDMFYVSVSCLAQVFLSPQAEESGSMSSVQEFCTNADSECFSDKSLSPNWTTNPHQSVRVQKIENFESSQNHPKSIGIGQESIFSHFGIIKTP